MTTTIKHLRLDPSELLLEVVSIVIAILLAFALNSWNDDRKTQASVNSSLVDIRREVESNRAILVRVMPRHRRFVDVYAAYLKRHRLIDINEFYGVFQSVASTGFHPFDGETTSWDIARSLPSAIAIPLDERTAIERTYAEQQRLRTESGRVIDDLHVTATVEYPNLYLPMAGIKLDASDVVAAENRLLELDDALLKRLPNS